MTINLIMTDNILNARNSVYVNSFKFTLQFKKILLYIRIIDLKQKPYHSFQNITLKRYTIQLACKLLIARLWFIMTIFLPNNVKRQISINSLALIDCEILPLYIINHLLLAIILCYHINWPLRKGNHKLICYCMPAICQKSY